MTLYTTFTTCLIAFLIALPSRADSLTEQIDTVVNTYAQDKQFMGTVLVARDKDIVINKAYGFANLEWNIANDTHTKFRLGSLTKQFTAASILLLEQQGKLRTDDLVKKYWSDIPSAWNNIKIIHLLTHTSGITNFLDVAEFAQVERLPGSSKQTLSLVRDKPLEFQPGDKKAYSNTGYIVLGELIELISGKAYSDFVQDNIFTPLNMTNSGYDTFERILPHRATGYSQSENGLTNASYIDMATPFSAGGLYSSSEDLLKWERALFEGNFLAESSLHKMVTDYRESAGMGLFITGNKQIKTVTKLEKAKRGSLRKIYKIDHAGGIPGFGTTMSYYPGKKITIIVLSNIDNGKQMEIAKKLEDLMAR